MDDNRSTNRFHAHHVDGVFSQVRSSRLRLTCVDAVLFRSGPQVERGVATLIWRAFGQSCLAVTIWWHQVLCHGMVVSVARRGGGAVLAEDLLALATLAGNTVVTAAVTDAWEAAREKFVRLLGRGDPDKTKLTEQRLAETHDQLTAAAGTDLERARDALAERWTGRLADLLEEDPAVEVDLRTAVQEVQAVLPSGTVSAADHAVAAGGDVNISASGGGIAAGVIHGNVAPPNPTQAGPVNG
jgi:hypothetical protein